MNTVRRRGGAQLTSDKLILAKDQPLTIRGEHGGLQDGTAHNRGNQHHNEIK